MQNSKVGAENDLFREINTKSHSSFRVIFVDLFILLLFWFGLIYVYVCLFAFVLVYVVKKKERKKKPNYIVIVSREPAVFSLD